MYANQSHSKKICTRFIGLYSMNEDKILRKYDTFVRTFVLYFESTFVRKYESTFVRRYVYTYNYCTNNNKHAYSTTIIYFRKYDTKYLRTCMYSTCTYMYNYNTLTFIRKYESTTLSNYLSSLYPMYTYGRLYGNITLLTVHVYTCTKV